MRRISLLLLLAVCCTMPLHAQLLEKVTAKDVLPIVIGKAQIEFASDAVLTNALFFGFEYQGVRFEFDVTDGKATGWLYRMYSASLDSAAYYIGARVPLLGDQAVKLPLDTITQYFPVALGTAQMTEPWADSDAALQGSKDGGGATFLQNNPDAKIPLAFVINNPVANRYIPQGQYWFFRYTASSDTLTCLVHASTGLPFRCISGNAPTITSLPKTTARVGQLYSYDVQAFGEPAPVFSLATAPNGMAIDASTGQITWIPAAGQEGLQDVTVVAANQSGSDMQSFQINVSASASGPTVTSTAITEAEAGKQYTYQVTVNGTPPITYALTEKPQGMIIEPARGTVLWIPTRVQAGPHTVRITATNSAGMGEQSFTLEVYKAPVLSVIPNQRIGPNKPFWYQAEVDARPAPDFAINAGPSGLAIHPQSGLITWTPTDQQLGKHIVLFEAANRFGKGQQSFEIEVDATVDASPVPSAAAFHILPHYPQPAAMSLTVPVQLGAASTADIDLYDALGRRVETHRGSAMPGARLSFTIATTALQPGVYLYRVRSGGEQQYRSFLVSR
ncbi:MAG: T9SS type A sorting domain-containing protein [Bacteroidetes bacterium]|nr:T9SS type A sorting domain-containing protein [Bacteroidota bacterium]